MDQFTLKFRRTNVFNRTVLGNSAQGDAMAIKVLASCTGHRTDREMVHLEDDDFLTIALRVVRKFRAKRVKRIVEVCSRSTLKYASISLHVYIAVDNYAISISTEVLEHVLSS